VIFHSKMRDSVEANITKDRIARGLSAQEGGGTEIKSPCYEAGRVSFTRPTPNGATASDIYTLSTGSSQIYEPVGMVVHRTSDHILFYTFSHNECVPLASKPAP
jgi:hypothetical protein